MDPLDEYAAQQVLEKGTPAPPPVKMVARVQRDSSLESCPTPTVETQQEMLAQLSNNSVCHVSSRYVPKHETLDQYPLPLGLLVSPLGNSKKFCEVKDLCPMCEECGAAITAFSSLNTASQWICVFCDTDNETPERYGQMEPDWSAFPELQREAAVEFDEGPCEHLISDSCDTVVFLLDLTMARDDLHGVVTSITEAVKDLEVRGTTKVSVIGFDNCVQIFHLDDVNFSASLCFPTVRPLNEAEQDMLQRPEIRQKLIVPIEQGLAEGGGLLNALETIASSSLYQSASGQASRERGLLSALDVAAFLTNPVAFDADSQYSAPPATSSAKLHRTKIIYTCGGAPNLFPKSAHNSTALQWEELSAKLRFHYGLHSLDGIFVSAHPCDVQDWMPHLMLHVSGGPMPVMFPPKSAVQDFGRALAASLVQTLKPIQVCAVSMSVHVGSNLDVTHVVGPLIGRANKIRHLHASNQFGANDALALYFDQKLASGDVSVIQVLTTYVDLTRSKLLKRVVTVPLSHTRDLNLFKSSISDSTSGVLLTKRVVVTLHQTDVSRYDELVHAIDRTLQNSVKQFEDLFASNLAALPFMCYSLRKLVLDMNADDQNYVRRSLLLRLNSSDTLALLFPKLFRVMRTPEHTIDVVGVPPEDLALNPHHVLAMDSFTHLFIWQGCLTEDVSDLLEAAMDHLLMAALDRNPAPLVYAFKEGDSGARFVTHQLVPSHLDRDFQAFPELREMSKDELENFILGFGFTDELSYAQWFKQVVAESKRFHQ